jgi:hypothetical protein
MYSLSTFAVIAALLAPAVVDAIPAAKHQLPANVSSLPFPTHFDALGAPRNSSLSKRQNADTPYLGDLEVHWQFNSALETYFCEEYGICVGYLTTYDMLWIQFIANGNLNDPQSMPACLFTCLSMTFFDFCLASISLCNHSCSNCLG